MRAASALVALLSLVLACEAAANLIFFAQHFPAFFSVVPFSDINTDFRSLGTPLAYYIFGLHNEHIVATTRVLSAIDLRYLGGHYQLHHYTSLAGLTAIASTLCALIWNGIAIRSVAAVGATGLTAFVVALMFSPLDLPLTAFPYFMPHIATTAFGICVASLGHYLTSRPSSGASQWLAWVALIASSVLTLVSSGGGFMLALVGLLVPLALNWRAARSSAAWITFGLSGAILLSWKILFAPPAGAAIATLASPAQWLGVADYAIRILGSPVAFAFASLPATRAFGLAVLGGAAIVILLACRTRERRARTTVGAAIVIAHLLSIGLVALGRAGTDWAPEAEKYQFYTLIVILGIVLILWDRRRNSTVLAAVMLTACSTTAAITLSHRQSALQSRSFFRSVEASAVAVALGISDPRSRLLFDSKSASVFAVAKERDLNLFARAPMRLIGRRLDEIPQRGPCGGDVNLRHPFTSLEGEPGWRLEGWALDRENPGRGAVLIAVEGRIAGGGVFTYARPDLIEPLRLAGSLTEATLGWIAYVPGSDLPEPVTALAFDPTSGSACVFWPQPR